MTLRLFDSGTSSLCTFAPLRPGRVGIYLCGPTVQAPPHVGHLRSAVVFDQLRRWLQIGHELDVTLVRNITDLDDKILAASNTAGVPWGAWAARQERAFADAYRMIGILPPTIEPRATGHTAEMLAFIDRLIKRGHAYRAGDDERDVYFDVSSWPDYGSLTSQETGTLPGDEHADQATGKRDPRDFALWKSVPSDVAVGEASAAGAAWDSPYGPGRPGWHLSCSTMILRYLGESFDIHGGGLDLRFPHHENEQAQSRAAGYGFARYWMHNGWVTSGGDKISKSLGNATPVDDLLQGIRPIDLRYYLGSAHYRSNLELTESALRSAAAAMRRIEDFIARSANDSRQTADASKLPVAFRNALDDDLNIPMALAVLHDEVRRGNTALTQHDARAGADARDAVLAMTGVLGINPHEMPWGKSTAGPLRVERALEILIAQALDQRAQARTVGDFRTADRIRDELDAAGIVLSDSQSSTTWVFGEANSA